VINRIAGAVILLVIFVIAADQMGVRTHSRSQAQIDGEALLRLRKEAGEQLDGCNGLHLQAFRGEIEAAVRRLRRSGVDVYEGEFLRAVRSGYYDKLIAAFRALEALDELTAESPPVAWGAVEAELRMAANGFIREHSDLAIPPSLPAYAGLDAIPVAGPNWSELMEAERTLRATLGELEVVLSRTAARLERPARTPR
jgi:hypothetical protein